MNKVFFMVFQISKNSIIMLLYRQKSNLSLLEIRFKFIYFSRKHSLLQEFLLSTFYFLLYLIFPTQYLAFGSIGQALFPDHSLYFFSHTRSVIFRSPFSSST